MDMSRPMPDRASPEERVELPKLTESAMVRLRSVANGRWIEAGIKPKPTKECIDAGVLRKVRDHGPGRDLLLEVTSLGRAALATLTGDRHD